MTDREKVIRGLEACNRESYDGCDCQNCPYYDDEDEIELGFGVCNIQSMFDDALVLLKEQEARVMTPKEVDEQAFNPVWLEVYPIGLFEPALFRYARPEYMKFAFSLKDNRAIERDASEYGFGWRCWTSRPTEEQREREPWQ